MKRFLFTLVITCASFSFGYAHHPLPERHEMLLRLPLLSEKNAAIITKALGEINGIQNIEACYQVKVMIIGYDAKKIIDDAVILDKINSLTINTTVEKIYSKDIPVIRHNYKVTMLRGADK